MTIVAIWFMASFTILGRDDAMPNQILAAALIASAVLGVWGFRSPN